MQPIFPLRHTVEITYPTNLRLLDRMGMLSHAIEDLVEDISYSPGDNLETLIGDKRAGRITTDNLIVVQVPGEDRQTFQDRAIATWQHVEEVLEVQTVKRLGIRNPFLVAFPTVEEAVLAFKNSFFDYYVGIFEGIGRPQEVRATVRFGEWRDLGGVIFSLTLRTTPIHILEDLKAEISEASYAGALVLDLDRYAYDVPIAEIPNLVAPGFEAGLEIAGHIADRISEQQEVPSAEAQ